MKKICLLLSVLSLSLSTSFVYASDYETLSKNMNNDFESFSQGIQQDYADYIAEHNRAYDAFKKDIEEKWAVFKDSTVTDWVQYNEDFSARSSVNFRDGFAEFEALLYENTEQAKRDAMAHLQQQIVLVDKECQENAGFILFEDFAELQGKATVQLVPNILDPNPLDPNSLSDPADADVPTEDADFLVLAPPAELPMPELMPHVDMTPQDMAPQAPVTQAPKAPVAPKPAPAQSESTKSESTNEEKAPYTIAVRVPLPSDYLQKAAAKYRPLVYSNSSRFNIKTNVVYAIIHTESYFNPFARSHIPAFGLMQLVPSSGGKDAYEYVFKKSIKPSESYLYDPKNNILLGTAYFSKVKDVYFKGINNEESAYIVSIAAYNTGIGNVAYALTGTKSLKNAVATINTMTPSQVCAVLLEKLPYDETKKYLEHILNRSAMYRGI